MLSHKGCRVKNLTPTETVFRWHIEQFKDKKKEALSRFSESESDTRLILADQGDHTLSEAKCEILKQECRADRADCAIRELQRQIHSSRLEIDHTNL